MIVFGHHPIRSLSNRAPDENAGDCALRAVTGPDCDLDRRSSKPIRVGADLHVLLHAHRRVVAYVAGPTHENRVTAFKRDVELLVADPRRGRWTDPRGRGPARPATVQHAGGATDERRVRMTTTTERFRPRLRPLSVGEILDVSIKICIAHWRTLLQTVLIVVVPVQIISTLLTADYTVSSFDFGATETQTPQETLDELNEYLGGLVLGTLLQVLAVLLASAACFRAIAQSYLGEDADWRSSLGYAVRRAPSLLWLTALYGLGVLIGFIFLIAPGVWLYIAWAFAMPILLTEGLKGRTALMRSHGLVKGRWWRTFGVIALGFILASIVGSLVQALFFAGIFFDRDNDALVLGLSALAGVVGLLITTPLQAALLAVVYFDLRVRKEGFDLELLAQGIGGTTPQQPDELWPPQPQEWTRDAESPWRAGPPPESQPPPVTDPDPRRPDRRDEDDEPPRLPGVPSG